MNFVRIFILVYFILGTILTFSWKIYIMTFLGIIGIIMTIYVIIVKDFNVEKRIQNEERKKIKEQIKLEKEKQKNNMEYKQDTSTIVIETNKFIIFLLIIIIIMLAIPLYKEYKEEQTRKKYINEAVDALNSLFKGN